VQALKDFVAEEDQRIKDEQEHYEKRVQEYETAEKIRRAERARQRALQEIENDKINLLAQAGKSIGERINPKNPDFNFRVFRRFALWNHWSDDLERELNAVLFGPPGCGKTRSMFFKAKRYIHNGTGDVQWINGHSFGELVSNRINTDHLKQADLLCFDDLGAAHFTAQRVAAFFAIMDYRDSNKLPTWISTNHGIDDLRKMLAIAAPNMTERDALQLSDRIIRRIVGTKALPLAKVFDFGVAES
jgi:DNA replication protein DnaC